MMVRDNGINWDDAYRYNAHRFGASNMNSQHTRIGIIDAVHPISTIDASLMITIDEDGLSMIIVVTIDYTTHADDPKDWVVAA